MASFNQPDFIERQEAAAKARKVALEKFRTKAADPALAERLIARAARASERSAIKATREIERAEKVVRLIPTVLGDGAWERFPNLKRLADAISARPAAQKAAALKDRHKFKTEMDADALQAMFPHLNAKVA